MFLNGKKYVIKIKGIIKEEHKNNMKRKKKKTEKIKNSLGDRWDNKHINIWIIGIPEEKEKKKECKKIFEEIILENFPNMAMEIAT